MTKEVRLKKTYHIGKVLNDIASKLQELKSARQTLAAELDQVIASAQAMKAELDGDPQFKKKRQMSPQGRQAIALASRKRWAAYRAAKKVTNITTARNGTTG